VRPLLAAGIRVGDLPLALAIDVVLASAPALPPYLPADVAQLWPVRPTARCTLRERQLTPAALGSIARRLPGQSLAASMPPVAIPPRLLDAMARLRAAYGAAQPPVPAPVPVAVTGDLSRDPRRRDPRLQPKAEAAEVRRSVASGAVALCLCQQPACDSAGGCCGPKVKPAPSAVPAGAPPAAAPAPAPASRPRAYRFKPPTLDGQARLRMALVRRRWGHLVGGVVGER